MPEYQLLQRILSYNSKVDKTNASPELLIAGSQNVLINDQEKVATRLGYSIYGAAGSGSNPIESEFDWQTSTNSVINLRAHGTILEAYFGTVDGVAINAWTNIGNNITLADADISFAPWWDTTENIDLLLFVNGGDKIWDWSGASTTLASATSNTITKNGTDTWAQSRFLTAGTRRVVINGTAYTYTGGEGTTTLTGVTGNPSGEAAGSLIYQQIRENDNEPADTWINDFIKVYNNQLWLGSNKRNEIYVSKDTDFKDFAFSTPRVPGEGALLVLDSVGRAFAIQRDKMLISAGRSDWYVNQFEQIVVSTTLSETLKVRKLKTGIGSAARHHDLVTEVGDYVAFINFNNELMMLGEIENLEQPSLQTLSDPIKPDFDAEDFTNGHIKAHKNRIYVCSPVNSMLWINETRLTSEGLVRFWQPPQILPIRKLAVIGDAIYGHSSGFNETYKLFEGTDDNGKPINFQAHFSYRNYDDRTQLKKFDKWMTEGYIRGNTKITLQLRYNFQGAEQILEKDIDGADEGILDEVQQGMTPLGTTPLGVIEQATQQPKFRQISEFAPRDFFEIQAIYYSSAVDDQWELVAQGGNVIQSPNSPNYLTR